MLDSSCSAPPAAPAPGVGTPETTQRYAIPEVLTPADILLDLDEPTKERALEAVARFIAARHGLVEESVLASLVKREKVGSTAVGCGIAIPHARVKYLSRPAAAFVRMKIPIPFDAPDGKPVSDLFVLLVPQHATETHLSLLAGVAEMFCDMSFREGLRACGDADRLHAALAAWRAP